MIRSEVLDKSPTARVGWPPLTSVFPFGHLEFQKCSISP